jgi:hypothetical protein
MDATGRLYDSLTKRIAPMERGGMLQDITPSQNVRFAPDANRIGGIDDQ